MLRKKLIASCKCQAFARKPHRHFSNLLKLISLPPNIPKVPTRAGGICMSTSCGACSLRPADLENAGTLGTLGTSGTLLRADPGGITGSTRGRGGTTMGPEGIGMRALGAGGNPRCRCGSIGGRSLGVSRVSLRWFEICVFNFGGKK